MAPGDSLQLLVDKALVRAEIEYQKKNEQAERTAERVLPSPESEAARMVHLRGACFEFLGTVLFAFIDGYSRLAKSDEDLRHQVGWMIAKLRDIILKDKWPTPRWVDFNRETQQFDVALIHWLEIQPDWMEYEARTMPQTPVGGSGNETPEASVNPPFHLRAWPADLPVRPKSLVQAALLEIHADFLDEKVTVRAECWRRAYDVIAAQFASAGMLSKETMNVQIPNLVADACVDGGWFEEGWVRARPTAIFTERLGLQYCPYWRQFAFIKALGGRIAHWSGRMLQGRTAESLRPESAHREQSRSATAHRRGILKAHIAEKGLPSMDVLARRAGISLTALYAMTRGDRTRYSSDKLENFLKMIGCTHEEWWGPNPGPCA